MFSGGLSFDVVPTFFEEKSVNLSMSSHNSFSRACLRAFLLAAATASASGVMDVYAESKTIYKETFQYCTSSLGKPAADETGWMGLVTGLPKEKFSNLKVFSYGSSVIGGSVNSAPHGKAQGYSFWFRPTYGLSVITSELSFDVGLISKYPSTVEYEQRLSGADAAGVMNQTQLIFLIDDTWYISGTATRQEKATSWEPVKLDPSTLLYGVAPYVTGLGAATPTAYNNSLPLTGTVRAFGVFVAEVNGRVRVENFTLTTTGPLPAGLSTTVQEASFAACPATSPDVTGAPAPTPTPDPEDSEGGIDRGTPELPTPPAQPRPLPGERTAIPGQPTPEPTPHVHTVDASFCSTSEQGAGRRVKVSRERQKAFVSKGIPKTSVGVRDRALAHLYATRIMPIGAAVNVRIGDYDPTTGKLKLSLKRGAVAKTVTLPKPVQATLKRYIASLGAQVAATDPMFGALASDMATIDAKKAACYAELKSVITKRAQAARLAPKLIFVK